MASVSLTIGPDRARNLVPMAHVADVERSVDFYSLLGLAPADSLPDSAGRLRWAMMVSYRPELMFALADGPVDPAQQAVLFYMYAENVAALLDRLLGAGLRDGGDFYGQPHDAPSSPWRTPSPLGVVSTVMRPPYMPAGEVRVHDPGGYCVLIGQRK